MIILKNEISFGRLYKKVSGCILESLSTFRKVLRSFYVWMKWSSNEYFYYTLKWFWHYFFEVMRMSFPILKAKWKKIQFRREMFWFFRFYFQWRNVQYVANMLNGKEFNQVVRIFPDNKAKKYAKVKKLEIKLLIDLQKSQIEFLRKTPPMISFSVDSCLIKHDSWSWMNVFFDIY